MARNVATARRRFPGGDRQAYNLQGVRAGTVNWEVVGANDALRVFDDGTGRPCRRSRRRWRVDAALETASATRQRGRRKRTYACIVVRIPGTSSERIRAGCPSEMLCQPGHLQAVAQQIVAISIRRWPDTMAGSTDSDPPAGMTFSS